MDYKQLSRIADSKIIDGSDVKRAELLAEKWGDNPKRWMVAWKKQPTIERAKVFADKANELNFAAVAEQFKDLQEFINENTPISVTDFQSLEDLLSKRFEKFYDAVWSMNSTDLDLDYYLEDVKATTEVNHEGKSLQLIYNVDSSYPDELNFVIKTSEGQEFQDEGELVDCSRRVASDIVALFGIDSDGYKPHSFDIQEFLGQY